MKLKSLTLVGFKSFADKTRLEFHDGVTCVVGPNGCGKSNVVDAVKWVLGEQSPKSLRGDEMADVLFNGTPQRRSAGFAEVVLTFEDSAGILQSAGDAAAGAPPDAPDPPADRRIISIGRRLYRSGESEYLVNNQPVRLRDVREMFMDTGVGVRAYSLIEQGRVEAFLQASPTDRRIVFDEAAGISKYKARKREAVRRLERVDQNLLRLTDILGEVQKRLRSIKYQAGKARSYQQYAERLKELRALFAQAEYHRLGDERRGLQGRCDELTDALSAAATQIDRLEAARTATETELADLERNVRALDGRISDATAQSATCHERCQMLAARAGELADAIAADASRCEQLEARVETTGAELQERGQGLVTLDAELEDLSRREQALRAEHAGAVDLHQRLAAQLDDEKNGTVDLLRRTAQLHNEIHTYTVRRENLHTQRQRLAGRAEEIAQLLERLLARRTALEAKRQEIESVLGESRARLERTGEQAGSLQETARRLGEVLSQAEQAHSALRSRKSALEEMQSRLVGVGEGVRRVRAAARQGRCPFLRGMLAELIAADVEHAHVIEAALGAAAQWLIADRLEDVLTAAPALAEILDGADGVEMICLDQLPAGAPEGEDLPHGAIARASRLVRCEPALAPAVEALLGSTLIVPSLTEAMEIRRAAPGRWRLVTTAGDALEPDGRVRIGPAGAAAGLIWRQSELEDLATRLQQGERHIAELHAQCSQVRSELAHLEEVTSALRTAIYEANAERVERQTSLEGLEEQIADLRREAPLLDEEVRQLAAEIDSAVRAEHAAGEKAAELESLHQQRQSQIARLTQEVAEVWRRLQALSQDLTAAQIALAAARQKRSAADQDLQRLREHAQALTGELASLRERIEQARRRRAEALDAVAEARSRMEALAREKDALLREAQDATESRRSLDERLGQVRQQLAGDRKRHDELAAQVGQARLALGEMDVRIENLIARTAEEIGMDLPAAHAAYVHDDRRDWEAVRAEIADLRGKIERLGNVNLDAIAEQDELVAREQFLSSQIEDVRTSQKHLMELIRRINAESRRRFEEAFQEVREHFNELFRKLFGGGKADVLLTDPDDPLESGIEIVARPPGKELRSITLLSGGEKTMTALALLFGFFRSRPSPFCILDEVDAALDEPNTERFVNLVREFLASSQFIIVSHAKRTIGMADQIYGVTMQEPGVSRQISVRFEEARRLAEPAEQTEQAVGA